VDNALDVSPSVLLLVKCFKSVAGSEIISACKDKTRILCSQKIFLSYRKVWHRGLEKQVQKINIMFVLVNLYLDNRKSLLAWLN
jgi:hypothetical protein